MSRPSTKDAHRSSRVSRSAGGVVHFLEVPRAVGNGTSKALVKLDEMRKLSNQRSKYLTVV